MSIRQDTKLLGGNIVETGAKGIKRVCEKFNFSTEEIDYFLPHMSSEFFRSKIEIEAEKVGCPLPQSKCLPTCLNLAMLELPQHF